MVAFYIHLVNASALKYCQYPIHRQFWFSLTFLSKISNFYKMLCVFLDMRINFTKLRFETRTNSPKSCQLLDITWKIPAKPLLTFTKNVSSMPSCKTTNWWKFKLDFYLNLINNGNLNWYLFGTTNNILRQSFCTCLGS